MENIVDEIRKEIQNLSIEQIVAYLANRFGTSAAFSTSFGIEDQVLTHIIATQNLDITYFTLDTGRLFEQTYTIWDKTIAKYGISIQAFYPNTDTLEKWIAEKGGPNSFYESIENRKQCCSIRKIEPLKRAITGKNIWITGIRAEQSNNRSNQPMVEWDSVNSIIKIHPLLNWSYDKILTFINENNVPINSLHKSGFVSIGCAPCTRAIAPNEDFRAGRWWWENSKKECGLHSA